MFAWKADVHTVLVIECKSIVADLQDLIATMDRKRRLAADITLEELSWRPAAIGSVLVLPDRSAARARVTRHGAIFEAALPARNLAVRAWLKEPVAPLAGIWFLRCCDGGRDRGKMGGPIRVVRRANQPVTGSVRRY